MFRSLCVLSGKFLPLSGPQCPRLSNGEMVSALPTWGLLWVQEGNLKKEEEPKGQK